MNITIVKGTLEYLEECKIALMNSQIGETYYSNEEVVDSILKDGINKGEIFAALNNKNKCLGYLWFTLNGAFYGFPYLRSIAVQKEFRNQGVGKLLLDYFENVCFNHRPKIFMLVSDFNISARRLFERLDYQEVGVIPSLFQEGITEHIMMKAKLSS